MPYAFIDLKRVTKSYIPAANALEKVNVQEGQPSTANESKATIKHGRPLGSKDKKILENKRKQRIKKVKLRK